MRRWEIVIKDKNINNSVEKNYIYCESLSAVIICIMNTYRLQIKCLTYREDRKHGKKILLHLNLNFLRF